MHLTYPDSDHHSKAASPAKSGETGAPEVEIEITPEMIDAAASILDEPGLTFDLSQGWGLPWEVAERMLRAAFQARVKAL